MPSVLRDLIALLGVSLIVLGVGYWSIPAAVIVAGCSLLGGMILYEMRLNDDSKNDVR